MDTIDGTKPLTSMGEAFVAAERKAGKLTHQPAPLDLTEKVRSRGDVKTKTLELIRRLATEEKPITTASLLEQLPDIGENTISATISSALLKEKHLHRRRVDTNRHDSRGHKITQNAYWFNEAYVNPLFGKKSIREKAQPKKKAVKPKTKPQSQRVHVQEKPAPVRVEEYVAIPQAIPSTLQIHVAGHSFTLEEAKQVYEQLRNLFISTSGVTNG